MLTLPDVTILTKLRPELGVGSTLGTRSVPDFTPAPAALQHQHPAVSCRSSLVRKLLVDIENMLDLQPLKLYAVVDSSMFTQRSVIK